MSLSKTAALTLLICTCSFINAQEDLLMQTIHSIVNELTEETGSENAELFTEMLLDLAAAPVIINSGDEAEISRLFFLTPFQAEALASYIRRTGPVVSAYELAAITGFNRATAEMMLPFITLSIPSGGGPPAGRKPRHRLIATSSLKFIEGVTAPELYPFKSSLRYRITAGRVTAAFTAASDPGEKPLYSGSPDFVSGGVAVTGTGFLTNMIIGDFSARFGMGLTINSGYKPFLTLTNSSYMGHRDGFTLSASVNENNYLRGAAISTSMGNVSLSAFISSRYRDARLRSDTAGNIYADILATVPLHNSLSGVSARGSLAETTTGASAGFRAGNFRGAITLCQTIFTHEVREGGATPADLYAFRGTSAFNAGVSYRMSHGRITGAGEISSSGNRAIATAHSLNIRFDDRFTANFIYRNYSPGYYGHISGGPGRNSTTTNEEGLMGRLTFEAGKGLFIHAGTDIYRFPWLKTGASFPSYGFRGEIMASYEPREPFFSELRISSGETWSNLAGSAGMPAASATRQTTARLRLGLRPSTYVSFSANAFCKHTASGAYGSMLAGDITYNPAAIPVSIWLRHALFTTSGFETALYLYENDMLYGFSVPAHYGEGSRTAIVITVKVKRSAELRLKYGVTNRSSLIGQTGQTELKGQLRINF